MDDNEFKGHDVVKGHVVKGHVVSNEQLAGFIATKGQTFPYNQLTKANNCIDAKWIVLKETTQEGHTTFTMKSSNIPPNALTHLIVTFQAMPYTPAMSDVMDYMFDGSIALYYPDWYRAVNTMMEALLQDSTSQIQRYLVFYHAIKLRLQAIFEMEVGKYSNFVLQKWADWFFATGYREGVVFGDLILDSIDKGKQVIASIEEIDSGIQDYEEYY